MSPRKPKDILVMALRNLVIGDGGIYCTPKTYDAIKERVVAYSNSNRDRTIVINKFRDINHIRRIA
jgi:hypothetical protein